MSGGMEDSARYLERQKAQERQVTAEVQNRREQAIERIINQAYQEHLEQTGRKDNKKKHPSREEYGKLFRQTFPWVAAVLEVTKMAGGEDDRVLRD